KRAGPTSPVRACPRPMKLTARVAYKSMNRAQEQNLAQANGYIAELKVQIVRERVIVKYALEASTGVISGPSNAGYSYQIQITEKEYRGVAYVGLAALGMRLSLHVLPPPSVSAAQSMSASLIKTLFEGLDASLGLRIVCEPHQHTDGAHAKLLCIRR